MREQGKRAIRFTNVHVENWRNFSQVSVDLQRRVFLVGPNASGKSNFLDLFRFLRDIVAVGGGLREAVRRRGGVRSLRCLAARRYSDIVIRVSIGGEDSEPLWTYSLAFSQDNRQRPTIREERIAKLGSDLRARPDDEDKKDPERLTQTHLEQVNVNQPFRELADFLGSTRYLHIVPQLIREPDRSVGRQHDPYGGDFLEQVAGTPAKTRDARLRRILHALKVAVPQLDQLELSRDDRGTPHLRGRYAHWRPHGAWQTEEVFSDGALRLLGLLWAAQEGAGPLLLEEPELSLHPEVVRFIPQMLAQIQRRVGRQVLLSTHSTDLLQDDGIGLDEVLLLLPSSEGTEVRPASHFREIRHLLDSGASMAHAVIPRTRPASAEQLVFALTE
ncbi:MAG TPA: AAA family ATPase [Armatimonadota bacterium]|nr:AAA family ATPase [Armatimonadota bacterium]